MPITGMILERARSHPEQPAIVGANDRITYGELVDDGRRVRAAVEHMQRAPRPVVAVSTNDAFAAARILTGLAGFDAVSATIDPRWPIEHQLRVVLGTGISVLISDSDAMRDALAHAGWSGVVVTLAEFQRLERELPLAAPASIRAGDEPFLMLFSSGTTSNPKAFLKTRAQYRANFAVSSAYLEPRPGVATLAPGPLSYSLTLYALIECLASGGSCHVADEFDGFAASRRIADEGVTRIVAVPAVLEALALAARRSPERFAAVELFVAGGANLSARIRESVADALPGVRLVSYYGAAEIGFIGDSRGGDGTAITLYDGIDAQVRGPSGDVLPDGEIGELWIRADATSDGYLPATTDEQLRDDTGWATVHDQARLRGCELDLLGRAGDIVVTGGHKVSLPEVERAFETLPGVGAVCAIATPDASLGSVVALVLEGGDAGASRGCVAGRNAGNDAGASAANSNDDGVANPAAGGAGIGASNDAGSSASGSAGPSTGRQVPDKAVVLAHARARLAPQFVPRRVYRVRELPRTVGGKIRRSATAELVAAGEAVRL